MTGLLLANPYAIVVLFLRQYFVCYRVAALCLNKRIIFIGINKTFIDVIFVCRSDTYIYLLLYLFYLIFFYQNSRDAYA